MRILAIKRATPAPKANGLDLPVGEILGRLAARHDVLLACWEGELQEGAKAAVPTLVRPLDLTSAANPAGATSRVRDVLLDHYGFTAAAAPWLRNLIAEWRPDVVVGIDCPALPALAANTSCPRVAYLIDNQFLAARQDLLRGQPSYARALIEFAWSWRFHRRYGSAAEAFIFVTEREAAGFERFTTRPRLAIPNGVDVEHFRPRGTARDDTVVFIGSLDFPPNIEAAAWFCECVWPLVRSQCPQARFQIVGRDPVRRLLALTGRDQVELIADPPDIRPYLARAAVAVAPMRSGGGVKNKILESWAMGTAMVATRMSLAGLAARPGQNILTADGPADFARAVVQCLRDVPERERLADCGRKTVVAEHTWERAAGQFEACLDEVLAATQGRITPRAACQCSASVA